LLKPLLCLLLALSACLGQPAPRAVLGMKTGVLLRMHVIAQDDTAAMQAVKAPVRDAVRAAYDARVDRASGVAMLTQAQALLPGRVEHHEVWIRLWRRVGPLRPLGLTGERDFDAEPGERRSDIGFRGPALPPARGGERDRRDQQNPASGRRLSHRTLCRRVRLGPGPRVERVGDGVTFAGEA